MSNDGKLPTLWIGLLGPPEIKWDSSSLTLARRQTRALLYRLAVHPLPISRTQLGFLFWPDIPETSARRNLTHLLTLVRRALPHPALLFSEGDSFALNPQRTQSDTNIFATLTGTSDLQARPDALMQAAALYRGPLLEGFALPDCPEFESWLDEERRVWERRYDGVLAAVVEAQTARGHYTAAIASAHRALARDNLAEEMHRRLIDLYRAIGDRAAALRQFEECALVLDRELGVAPLPETRAVYEAVRDGISHVVPRTAPPPTVWIETKLTSHTVPLPLTSLIGRRAMLTDVLALLQREGVRLLTLTGPGGTGKTRVALALARKLEGTLVGNVVFVPLAPLRDPTQVLGAIAEALGLSERDNRPPLLRLGDALAMRESILVLDNFEHLLEAAQDVAALLLAAPRLKVLVTSRALLNIAGEHAYPVPPLDLPDLQSLPVSGELAKVNAVTLFLERVRERVPTFELTGSNATYIAAICVRLDCLPLAIELAAARAVLLSPRMLLARLDHRLALLTGGPRNLPARQQTLRATICTVAS